MDADPAHAGRGRLSRPLGRKRASGAPARLPQPPVPNTEQVGFREATSVLRNGVVKAPAPGPPLSPPRPHPHLPTTRAPDRKSPGKQWSPPRSRGRGASAPLGTAAPARGEPSRGGPRAPRSPRAEVAAARATSPSPAGPAPAPSAVTAPGCDSSTCHRRPRRRPRTHLSAGSRASSGVELGSRCPVPSRAAAGHEGLNAAELGVCLAHPRPRAPPCAAPPPAQACLCLSQTGLPLPLRPPLPPPLSLTPATANSAAATSAILAVTEGVGGRASRPARANRGPGPAIGGGALAPETDCVRKWAGLSR